MGKVVISQDALSKSAAKYRREILMMPVFSLEEFLKHVSLRTGIRYSETVGEMSGSMELGPYSEDRIDDSDVNIVPARCTPISDPLSKNSRPTASTSLSMATILPRAKG